MLIEGGSPAIKLFLKEVGMDFMVILRVDPSSNYLGWSRCLHRGSPTLVLFGKNTSKDSFLKLLVSVLAHHRKQN